MSSDLLQKRPTRREMLRGSTALAGGAFLVQLFPGSLLRAALPDYVQQTPAADPAATFRAQMGAAPIQSQKLADNLTLLSGPGGNIVVLNGPDGKFIVDTFVSPAWPRLKETLDGIGNAPLRIVIDTHWHFDHTDNNALLPRRWSYGPRPRKHQKAHVRATRPCRFSTFTFQLHQPMLCPNRHSPPATSCKPTATLSRSSTSAPAHTDSDIYVHFEKANVIHMGDTFFNGIYPFIDAGHRRQNQRHDCGCRQSARTRQQ